MYLIVDLTTVVASRVTSRCIDNTNWWASYLYDFHLEFNMTKCLYTITVLSFLQS